MCVCYSSININKFQVENLNSVYSSSTIMVTMESIVPLDLTKPRVCDEGVGEMVVCENQIDLYEAQAIEKCEFGVNRPTFDSHLEYIESCIPALMPVSRDDEAISLESFLQMVNVKLDHGDSYFLGVSFGQKIYVTEYVLEWCGYTGMYSEKKRIFKELLLRNCIPFYYENDGVSFSKNQKNVIVMKLRDFESAILLMRSSKAANIRDRLMAMKHITLMYSIYRAEFYKVKVRLVEASFLRDLQRLENERCVMERKLSNALLQVERQGMGESGFEPRVVYIQSL